MSKYLGKPRVKPSTHNNIIQNKYWKNALARARANYHRMEDHSFSAAAHYNAHREDKTVLAIASDLGVSPVTIMTPSFKAWYDRFIFHVASKDNPFAAYNCFAHMEAEAKKAVADRLDMFI